MSSSNQHTCGARRRGPTHFALGALLALSAFAVSTAMTVEPAAADAFAPRVEAQLSANEAPQAARLLKQAGKQPRRPVEPQQPQGNSIVGEWEGDYSWSTGAGGPLTLSVFANNTLQAGDFLPWEWTQTGNQIRFTEQVGNAWTGTLRDGVISGTMRRFDGSATGTFEFRRVGGGGGGGDGAIIGSWEVGIQFSAGDVSTFTQAFSSDGTWTEDGNAAGEWRREGDEYVWIWGEFGSGRMNFRATINGDQGSGQTNAGYNFNMTREGVAPPPRGGAGSPVGDWGGTIVWQGANTIDLGWTFNADGTIVTSFGERGTWTRSGNGFRGSYRGGGANDLIEFEGTISGNRISGTLHSDYQGGFDGTFSFTR